MPSVSPPIHQKPKSPQQKAQQPPTANCQLPTANCQLTTDNYRCFVFNYTNGAGPVKPNPRVGRGIPVDSSVIPCYRRVGKRPADNRMLRMHEEDHTVPVPPTQMVCQQTGWQATSPIPQSSPEALPIRTPNEPSRRRTDGGMPGTGRTRSAVRCAKKIANPSNSSGGIE